MHVTKDAQDAFFDWLLAVARREAAASRVRQDESDETAQEQAQGCALRKG